MKNKEMNLLSAPKGVPLIVNKIVGNKEVVHHLAALGVINGRRVSLTDKRGDLVVIACSGAKYVLGRSVTDNIYVIEAEKTKSEEMGKS